MNSYVEGAETPSHRMLWKYIEVMRLHRSILDREVNKTGVYRSQHQILMFLADHPGASQKEIALMHHVSTATIAVSLKKLEKGGYVSRIVDQADNRYNQICLTERGLGMVSQSRTYFDKVEDAMFQGFSEEDFRVMEQFFCRVCNNLEAISKETEGDIPD